MYYNEVVCIHFIILVIVLRSVLTGKSLDSRSENVDSWLFSRFSTGWICGLHADWTELTACVDEELTRAHGSSLKRRLVDCIRYMYKLPLDLK